MKQIYVGLLLFFGAAAAQAQTVRQLQFSGADHKMIGGNYVERIRLDQNALPEIKPADLNYEATDAFVPDSLLVQTPVPSADLSMERKQAFAMVRMPAYRKGEHGEILKLKSYTLNVTEKAAAAKDAVSAGNTMRVTGAANSVLAEGTWQKLGVNVRGVYKVDYDFVKNTLGQSGNINSANIRLMGNGGYMLSEDNAVARPDDLLENALEMHDGGDGNFGPGDYFLFYATGTVEWERDSIRQLFFHKLNLYSDTAFYFISFNSGAGLRMNTAPVAGSPNTVAQSYNEYAYYENEQYNLGMFGKIWWGDEFGFTGNLKNNQTFTFNLNKISDSVYFRYNLASAAIGKSAAAAFYVKLNGIDIGTFPSIYGIAGEDGTDPAMNIASRDWWINPSSGVLNFNVTYQKYVSNAKGYLDYIEINTRRALSMSGMVQMPFRDWRSVGPESITRFDITDADGNIRVWDVTDPQRPMSVSGNFNAGTYSFVQSAERLKEYVAFGNITYAPVYKGAVPNQNLHALPLANYLIVTHPEFTEAANLLADYHRNNSGMTVNVVTTQQVYNEFGSGVADISAIRDFARFFYKRAGTDTAQMPKYLLLLGQASYDYKNILRKNPKQVPTFETPESLGATGGYCTDDFYTFLDDNEYLHRGFPLMDIGVGRIPATSAAEAVAVVKKIIRYKSNESLGPWRINNVFVADKEDGGGDHLLDADAMYEVISGTTDIYKDQKVYLDAMNIISTPGGPRCPDANKLINDNVSRGAFLINYSGHGSIYSLSSKRIVTQDDYVKWNNDYKLPILITATCDFSRFDNPALQSSGEKIMLKGNGGAIALVTTTQVVYATYNKIFNMSYLHTQFTKGDHGWNAFGDAFRISKNFVINSGDTVNSRKFALLGDPALLPDFPRYDVATDSVLEDNGSGTATTDSVRSLGRYTLYGSVRDDYGHVINSFNGKVYVTFFDKAQRATVYTDNSGRDPRTYRMQNNVIYRGTATVTDGKFNVSFITPKDINYDMGKGKISYYAENGSIDAAGFDSTVSVGGFSEFAVADEDTPLVRPFMNDSLFKTGGLTGTNSVLFAIISDKSGINVSGNYVGHDLTAVLDDAVEVPYILNDYYETAPNTYQRGFVSFPMSGLKDGIHTLRVKAWDVYNNSGEGIVVFEVANGDIVKIRNISNYPNPFGNVTHFVFEHNHPNEALTATINIYNMSGALLRTIENNFTPTGSNTAELTWDGTGNGGEKLPSGVYPYRIRIATEKNTEDLGYQKAVLIR